MKLKSIFLLIVFLLTVVPVALADSKKTETMPAPAAGPKSFIGTVEETMDAAGYTYVQVDDGTDKIWAAAPGFEVKVGDRVIVPPGSLMNNFSSKTLKRTFEAVYFVSRITKEGEKPVAAGLPEGHMPIPTGTPGVLKPLVMDFSGIQKPEGGKTVAEVYAERNQLVDQEVLMRGKVVKFVSRVMGRNWLHLQDGTGEKGSNDLTITTNVEVASRVGDTILVRGRVMLNKDFGSGYRYDVLIVDGKITVEP